MLLFLMMQAAAPQPLNLTCLGSGTANKPMMATLAVGGGTATLRGMRQQGFADQVDLMLFAGDDRIRMPRTMLPAIRGGAEGWFKLKNVKADARAITAKAAVNFINNPNVHIDRVTGTITISGKAGEYSGVCEAVAPDAPAKF